MVQTFSKFLLFVIIVFNVACAKQNKVITTVSYKSGKTKLKSVEHRAMFKDVIIHKDECYYENGGKKSELVAKYGTPKVVTIESTEPGRYSLLLYKKYKLYYENGKVKEEGELVKGNGKVVEYEETGQVKTVKKVENFISTVVTKK